MISDSDKATLLIKKFLDDTLTSSEKIEFDALLKQEDFKKELHLQTNLLNIINENRRRELEGLLDEAKDELESVEKDNLKDNSSKTSPKKSKLTAILIGFLIGISAFFLISKFLVKPKMSNVFAEYYSPYPPENLERGQSNSLPKSYSDAMYLYADGNYKDALAQFETVLPETDKLNLYKAICLLELGKNNESLTLLESLVKSSNTNLRQQAEWYLLLNVLSSDKKEKTKDLAKKIDSQPNHIFNAKAKQILLDLK